MGMVVAVVYKRLAKTHSVDISSFAMNIFALPPGSAGGERNYSPFS